MSTARFCRTGQLVTADTWFRTCRTSSFFTVTWQLARFQLVRRIARSLGDSWASLNLHSPSTPSQTHSTQILGFILIWYLFISKNNKCQTQMLKKAKRKKTPKNESCTLLNVRTVRPNQWFIQTQHYSHVLKSYCPFNHDQYFHGLITGVHTLLGTFHINWYPNT